MPTQARRDTSHFQRKRQRGISLVETLCAFVVLALGAGVAFESILTSVTQLARARNLQDLYAVRAQTLEHVRAINPAQQSQGSTRLGAMTATWQSEPIAPATEGSKEGAATFTMGLFRVKFEIKDEQGSIVDRFETQLAGHVATEGSNPYAILGAR